MKWKKNEKKIPTIAKSMCKRMSLERVWDQKRDKFMQSFSLLKKLPFQDVVGDGVASWFKCVCQGHCTLLVNTHTHRPDGPLGLYADFQDITTIKKVNKTMSISFYRLLWSRVTKLYLNFNTSITIALVVLCDFRLIRVSQATHTWHLDGVWKRTRQKASSSHNQTRG